MTTALHTRIPLGLKRLMPTRALGTPEASSFAHWHSSHSVAYWSLPPISPHFFKDLVNVLRIAWISVRA